MLFGHGSKTLVPSNELVNGCSSPGKKNKPEIVAFRRSFDSAGTGGGFGLKAFSMFHPKLRLQVLRSLSMWHCPRECQQITSQLGSRDSWKAKDPETSSGACYPFSIDAMLIQSINDPKPKWFLKRTRRLQGIWNWVALHDEALIARQGRNISKCIQSHAGLTFF